jgi:hypothetical protein
MRLSDEALHRQLVDEVTRTGRLLLIRDHYDAPSCGTDIHAHPAEHQVDPKKLKNEGKWGGNSALVSGEEVGEHAP